MDWLRCVFVNGKKIYSILVSNGIKKTLKTSANLQSYQFLRSSRKSSRKFVCVCARKILTFWDNLRQEDHIYYATTTIITTKMRSGSYFDHIDHGLDSPRSKATLSTKVTTPRSNYGRNSSMASGRSRKTRLRYF